MSNNNTSITAANASLLLSSEPVLPLVTFSQADFEMQNAAQFWVPEDQNDNGVVKEGEREEILQGQLLPSLPQGRISSAKSILTLFV